MPRPKRVKITKDGQEAEVNEPSVRAYERHGWKRADTVGEERVDSPDTLEVEASEDSGTDSGGSVRNG